MARVAKVKVPNKINIPRRNYLNLVDAVEGVLKIQKPEFLSYCKHCNQSSGLCESNHSCVYGNLRRALNEISCAWENV